MIASLREKREHLSCRNRPQIVRDITRIPRGDRQENEGMYVLRKDKIQGTSMKNRVGIEEMNDAQVNLKKLRVQEVDMSGDGGLILYLRLRQLGRKWR